MNKYFKRRRVIAGAVAVTAAAVMAAGGAAAPSSKLTAARARALVASNFAAFRDQPHPGLDPRAAAATTAPLSTEAWAGEGSKLYAYLNGSKFCIDYEFGGSAPGSAGACGPADGAAAQGAGLVYMPHGGAPVLASLVPDSVAGARLRHSDGSSSFVPATNNALVVVLPGVTGVTMITRTGEAAARVRVPSGQVAPPGVHRPPTPPGPPPPRSSPPPGTPSP